MSDIKNRSELGEDRFVWSDEYCFGNEGIDTQHRQIFEFARELQQIPTTQQSDPDFIAEKLQELATHAMSHFRLEEAVMKQHKYPQLQEHIEVHQAITQKLFQLTTTPPETTEEILQFIDNKITEHIFQIDSQYAKYIQGSP